MKNWDAKAIIFLAVSILAIMLSGYLSMALAKADQQLAEINRVSTILLRNRAIYEAPEHISKGIKTIHYTSLGMPVQLKKK
jgi:hypothetical protein